MSVESPSGTEEITMNPRLSHVIKINDKLNNLVLSFESGYHYFLPSTNEVTKYIKELKPDSKDFREMDMNRQAIAEIGVDISRQMELHDLTSEEAKAYAKIVLVSKKSGEISDEDLDRIEETQGKMLGIYQELKKLGYSGEQLGAVELEE